MINKTHFKKFVKEGMKNILTIDVKNEWVLNGYTAYPIKNDEQAKAILNENMGDAISIIDGEPTDKAIDAVRLFEIDYLSAPEIKMTNFIEREGQNEKRIFISKNGESSYCNQKFLDVVKDYENCRYTQFRNVSPIYVWDKDNELVAFILPIRVNDPDYVVVKQSDIKRFNHFESQVKSYGEHIDELKKEIRSLERKCKKYEKQFNSDPVVVPIEDLKLPELSDEFVFDDCIPF